MQLMTTSETDEDAESWTLDDVKTMICNMPKDHCLYDEIEDSESLRMYSSMPPRICGKQIWAKAKERVHNVRRFHIIHWSTS